MKTLTSVACILLMLDPAAAIQQTKISASLDWFKARLLPGARR
jgi:hypothetical protein